MIQAILFDLDGTLVQSEKMKAQAFAVAVQRLLGLPAPDQRAIQAYRENVGTPLDESARRIIRRLGIRQQLMPLLDQYRVTDPALALVAMRRDIYADMVRDPAVLAANQWPHTIALLRMAREHFCRTGLATMSLREEAMHVLKALDLERELDLVLTREDVRNPKPDPEIYLLAAEKLQVDPSECLVLEDSVNGVRAGLAAGMNVVAIATPFTGDSLRASGVIKDGWTVRDPADLLEVISLRIAEHNIAAHPHGPE